MNKKDEIQKEIQQVSPYLEDKLKPYSKGQVPDGYFQRFEDSFVRDVVRPGVKEQLSKKSRPGLMGIVEEFFSRLLSPKYSLAIASVLVLLVASVWLLNPTENTQTLDFAALSEEEVEAFIEDNLDDFLIAELNLDADMESEQDLFENLDPELIETYSDEVLEEMELIDLENIF
jgi:hypothetical protein